jgi:hypothetical protein
MTETATARLAAAMVDDLGKRQRVRCIIRRIEARAPLFRSTLRAHRHDLGELVELTGIDDAGVFARMDGLDRDITDLLYWASGGEHDAHH